MVPTRERLSADELDLHPRVTAAYEGMIRRVLPTLAHQAAIAGSRWGPYKQLKPENPSRPLYRLDLEILAAAAAGATEAELRSVETHVRELIDDLTPASVQRDLAALDDEELEAEHAENRTTLDVVRCETPATLRAAAAADRREAAISQERARRRERRARELERESHHSPRAA